MVPNFYIIGAQKAGTTTINDILAEHPEVFMPEDKEIPFFYDERFFSLGKKNYEWYFRKSNGKKMVGNAPVNLLYLANITVRRMYEFNKELKFICCLRDPVDRAYSAYWYFRSSLFENAKTFEEALKNEELIRKNGTIEQKCNLTYIDHGLYYEQLKIYYEQFPSEQILILFFEELKNNPEMVFNKISKFLGIERNKFSEYKKSNITSSSRIKFVDQMIYKENKIKSIYKKCFSDKVRYKFRYSFLKNIADFNKKKFKKPNMNENTKEKLSKFYEQPNNNLEEFLKVDLSHWT